MDHRTTPLSPSGPDRAIMDQATKHNIVSSVPFWYHSIDLGDGILTPGAIPLDVLQNELAIMSIGDIRGKTVLDIGSWDGFYSFAAEASGARRVLAMDHFVWSLHLDRQQAYWRRCKDENRTPSDYTRVPGLLSSGVLPGKAGFDAAHQILDSRVEQLVADFMTVEPEEVGSWDLVFFRGILYHMKDPLRALRRLALVTRELAIIETAAIHLPGMEELPLYEFYGANELNADVSNWWAPNCTGLVRACQTVGFGSAEVVSKYPPAVEPGNSISRYRLTVHARR